MSFRLTTLSAVFALCAAVVSPISGTAQKVTAVVASHRVSGPDAAYEEIIEEVVETIEEEIVIETPAASASHNLQIVSMSAPIAEVANDRTPKLSVEVTIKNLGSQAAPVAVLALSEEDGGVKKAVPEIIVPSIPAGESVTMRVPVFLPTNTNGTMCFTGKIEAMTQPIMPMLSL